MTFTRKFSVTLFANLAIVAASILNNIMVVRIIGAGGQGLFTLVITSVTIIMTLAGGGAILEINRYLAKKDSEDTPMLFSNSLVLTFTVGISAWLWWVIFRGNPLGRFLDTQFIPLILLGIPFLLFQESARGILWGLEEIGKYNLISFFRSVSLLFSNFLILFLLHKNAEVAIRGWVITLGMGAFLSGWYIRPYLKYFKLVISRDVGVKSLNIGWRTFLISILALLASRIDIYFIRHFLDRASVGFYSIVVLIAAMANMGPMIGGMLIFNKAISQEAMGSENTAKLSRICMAYSGLIAAFLLLFGKYILKFLFGPDFVRCYLCLLYYLPALIAQNMISVVTMFSCGRGGFPVFTISSLFIALLANIILNVILIPIWGINGAAVSASLAIGLRAIMDIFYFRLKTGLKLSEFMVLRKSDVIELCSRLPLKVFECIK